MDTSKEPSLTATLDKTSIAAMPDDKLISLGLTPDEIKLLRGMPDTQLSSMIPLVVTAGKERAREMQIKLGFEPEVDIHGNRRCVYVDTSGARCEQYGNKDIPVCRKHKTYAASVGTYFKTPKLRETYNAFMNSPEKLKCDGEIALMRTMLTTIVSKLDDGNTNLEIVGAIISISEKITNTIDKMSKLEKITPEQLDILMKKMVDVAAKYIDPDKLSDFARDVEAIEMEDRPLRTTNGLPFLSEELQHADVVDTVVHTATDGTDIQRKALTDIANHMGVTTGG